MVLSADPRIGIFVLALCANGGGVFLEGCFGAAGTLSSFQGYPIINFPHLLDVLFINFLISKVRINSDSKVVKILNSH